MRVIWTAVLVLVEVSASAKADSGSAEETEYMSAGGDYVFKVKVADRSTRQRGPCRATLSQFWNGKSRTVWGQGLGQPDQPRPRDGPRLRAVRRDLRRMVPGGHESRRGLWREGRVDRPPVRGGTAPGGTSADHPVCLKPLVEPERDDVLWSAGRGSSHFWRRKLEETLFIRSYWGHVVSVDLSTGKPVAENDTRGLPAGQARFLARETSAFLEEHFRRLAKEYLHERNFFPDPTSEGIKGILLAMQSRLREPLPLLRKVAATDRFAGWAAPSIRAGRTDLKSFAEDAVREIEGEAANCVGSFQE
ncbi:MAG: hypothetical protein U0790_29165 [Isosphaeraceae bacterium]